MKRNLVFAVASILFFADMQAANASLEVSRTFSSQHSYFDAQLTLIQPGNSSSDFTNGTLQAKISINNIKASFAPYAADSSSQHAFCKVKFEPQWDTYFNAFYTVTFLDGPDRNQANPVFAFSVSVKLDATGKIIWYSKNPNSDFSYGQSSLDSPLEYHLGDFFSPSGNGITSKAFPISLQGGNTYYVEEDLELVENAVCISNGYGIEAIGQNVSNLSTIEVLNSVQQINAAIPSGKVALKNQAERISYSSSSGLPVEAIETDPQVCIVNGTVVILKKSGNCGIQFTQAGGNGFSPASKYLSFEIISDVKTTITCIKGKQSKKVTGVNPVCPKGYVKK